MLAIAGLMLLAFSLVDTTESDQRPAVAGVVIWLAACGGGAVLLIAIPTRLARAASLGLAAGLLFADGDISAKRAGYGGLWLVALATLIVAYGVGTSVLQWDKRVAGEVPGARIRPVPVTWDDRRGTAVRRDGQPCPSASPA